MLSGRYIAHLVRDLCQMKETQRAFTDFGINITLNGGGMQMAGMIFQTHSNITANFSQLCTPDYVIEYLPAKNYSI
jgi:hypothetical protein